MLDYTITLLSSDNRPQYTKDIYKSIMRFSEI